MNYLKPPSNCLRIASFDVAKGNFGQWIEDVNIDVVNKLKEKYDNLPKTKQRRVKGHMNSNIAEILREIYESGNRISVGVFDFRDDEDSTVLDIQTRRNLLAHLRSYENLWDTCDIIVIEQQYFNNYAGKKKGKGKGANMNALKIAEAVLIWFLDNYPLKEISSFGSQFKTQILGAPLGLNDAQRKKWAVEKAEEIVRLRGDENMISIYQLKKDIFRKRFNTEEKILIFTKPFDNHPKDIKDLANKIVRNKQKLDDFSDAFLQLLAYIFRVLVARF